MVRDNTCKGQVFPGYADNMGNMTGSLENTTETTRNVEPDITGTTDELAN
jgi:hypothetical protein